MTDLVTTDDTLDQKAANALAVILHAGTGGQLPASMASGLGPSAGQEYASGQAQLAKMTSSSAPAPTAATASSDTTDTTGGASEVDPVPAGTGVSQGYGVNGHPGIDLAVPDGTKISAAISGTVTHAANDDPGGYGQWVEITGPDGTVTRYGHLSSLSVAPGQTVKAGQVIGNSGGAPGEVGAGNATGAHLHFEVRQGGQTVDPTPWLAGGHQVIDANPSEVTAQPAQPMSAGAVAGDVLDIAAGQNPSHDNTPATEGTQAQQGTGSTADNDPGAVDAFLAATRQHESGGNYHIYNTSGQSNASGAYQFLNSTWQGAGGSTTAAAEASPEEQDRVARNMAMQLFNQFHSWRLVAIAWYGGPGIAEQVANGQDPGSPQGQGGYLAYGDTIARMMQGGK